MTRTDTTIWIGPPGTGKTTKIGELVHETINADQTPLICSLTRAAAAEVVGRHLPVSPRAVGTLHSHAYAALDAPHLYLDQVDGWNALQPAYGLSGGTLDVDDPLRDHDDDRTVGDELLSQYDLLRARMTVRDQWPDSVRGFATKWEEWKTETEVVDFGDLIDRAIRECPVAPTAPDVLYVDEAQDMSRLELELLRRWGRRAGRLVLVGDGYQALYVWRGAAPEMFGSPKVEADHRHVLSQSYRIPRAVHRAAIRWVSQLSDYRPIDYAARDADGRVDTFPVGSNCPDEIIEAACRHIDAGRSVMVMGSCSYLVAPTVAVARRLGIPFANPWRRKRGDWNPLGSTRGVSIRDRLLAFLRPLTGESAVDDFAFGHNAPDEPAGWSILDLHRWTDVLAVKGTLQTGAKAAIAEFAQDDDMKHRAVSDADLSRWFTVDACSFLRGCWDGRVSESEALAWYGARLTASKHQSAVYPIEVLRRHGRAALTEKPRLYVGTIHSFKGAEADVVFCFPDLSVAGMQEWQSSGSGRDAVVRLFYVAMTRAREQLYVCRPVSGRAAPVWRALN